MGEQPLIVAAVDIGTNSMRMLVTDGRNDLERTAVVTGLGRGVDRTGLLSEEAIQRTVRVLARFGEAIRGHGAGRVRAIATSASRDSANTESFFDMAETALGFRPVLIDGADEARLAFEGALRSLRPPQPVVVCDIGGGSTELVTSGGEVSVDIGSVRLTERAIPDRPAPEHQVGLARETVRALFSPVPLSGRSLIGVAGTWTSLASLLHPSRPAHEVVLTSTQIGLLVERLARLSIEETAAQPGLDPARAPVILGGALVAEAVMSSMGMSEATISEHDTLDGVAMRLLALP